MIIILDIVNLTYYIYTINYLINTNVSVLILDKSFFLNPTNPMQKRYEALRASFVDGLSAQQTAEKYGLSVHTINALRKNFKAKKLPPFFQPLTKGPKQPRLITNNYKKRIIELRKQNYSINEIEEVLARESFSVSAKTIHQILKEFRILLESCF